MNSQYGLGMGRPTEAGSAQRLHRRVDTDRWDFPVKDNHPSSAREHKHHPGTVLRRSVRVHELADRTLQAIDANRGSLLPEDAADFHCARC